MTKPGTYHHGNLPNELIRTATDMVESAGVAAFSLRAVADRLGVSATAAYRHFADRDALLTAVAMGGFSLLTQLFQQAANQQTDAQARLTALGVAYVRFAADHPHLHTLMFRPNPQGGPPPADDHSPTRQAFDCLLQAVAQCLPPDTGDVQRLRVGLALWSLVHGYAILARDGHFTSIPPDILGEPADILCAIPILQDKT